MEILDITIKMFVINIFVLKCFFKIIDEQVKNIKIVIASILLTIFYIGTKKYLSDDIFLMILLSYSVQIVLLKIIMKDKKKFIILGNLIANALVYSLFCISLFIEALLLKLLLRAKRVKYGISFLKNPEESDYFGIIMLEICAFVIFAYCLFVNCDKEVSRDIFIIIITLLIIMGIMIQKTLTLHYKQKLLAQNIEEYKAEIASKDAEIKSLSEEKYKISKLNHEFYNRQKALIHKVEEIINMNTETAEELDLSKQINDLTKEYTDKAKEIKTLDKLPSTGITEIDDMFKYMQSECKSKNIQFNLQINGNIYHMINNKIAQNKLVTMIGDHLRDAIIAIEFSENSFKSILAILGENNGLYEFCVFDTGIEFKIDTLLKLGLEPATTNKDSGGTGIGFMTTFETMSKTKASLIINEMHEMNNTDYTKSITIRFDGKNEYRIKSYRSDEIKKRLKDNRIIIEN